MTDAPSGGPEFFVGIAPGVVGSALCAAHPSLGVVLLSTCNRFEIYFEVREQEARAVIDAVVCVVAGALNVSAEEVRGRLRVRRDAAVVRHLFSVTAGLESLVVGDAQVAGQVKRALAEAQSKGTVSKPLHMLFQRALNVSKHVTSETGVGGSGRSVIHAALELAGQRGHEFCGSTALVIGTGAYSRVVVAALERLGVHRLGVFSRSGHQPQFAGHQQVSRVSARELVSWMTKADLVVAASGSPGYAVQPHTAELVAALRGTRRPLLCIDVTLARDIAPSVDEHDRFDVINLTDLNRILPESSTRAVAQATELIELAVTEFLMQLRVRESDDTVVALRTSFERFIAAEVSAVQCRGGDVIADEVRRSLRRVSRAFLHAPTVRVKELAARGQLQECDRVLDELLKSEA